MKSAVLVFPGINRERDMARAFREVTGVEPIMVWHTETELPDVDVVAVPGGFSYGDYLRCGAIAARSPIIPALRAHAAAGRHVLGVCNGFQILTETGLLPGALMRNASLRFVCKEVRLRVDNAATAFTSAYAPGQVIRCPIAHGEGNYFADPETLAELEGEGRVVFRYCDAEGRITEAANPNGAVDGIAGIVNAAGNVLGMMPHPENLIEALQGGLDGRGIFESLARAA
ncbi:phosphoribosylformylglycinamidine synthase subunit PurQ [Siculibacillus lacustris]|uniref:Phosphoribosylformylglycinamidine synthase subunit PurQ n=1 Tax=Siculibacillus lacustris TaxID=1549641 RepID=A0A4Q9VRX6_9HYPH|nr:phosphoribosylformylglycinamidine synthase subunit PurQ [Siculibacillus lacustris]TBW38207.1 phosphoribosylformylglycinamidine synthase subunit PurQ [Siculibacillus lacustris]